MIEQRVYMSNNAITTCCHAKVRVEGIPDFLGSKEVCTLHFTCLRCGKTCDLAMSIIKIRERKVVEQKARRSKKKS